MLFIVIGLFVHSIETRFALIICHVSCFTLYRVLSTSVKFELSMHFLSFIIVHYMSFSECVCMCFKKACMKCFHVNEYNIDSLVVLFIERLIHAVL